jgi:3-phosphoshikimate 1-carboxyvinyltransferase
MGVKVHSSKTITREKACYSTSIEPPRPLVLRPLSISLPGDFSAAAFLIVAALITPGSNITLRGVGLNATRTGLLDALLAMGAKMSISNQSTRGGEPVGDLTVRHSRLEAIRVSGEQVVRMIDEFPAFAVAAASAFGTTCVLDAAELRHKESDRISALCMELRNLGVDVEEQPDGFTIHGNGRLNGGNVEPHGDHRLAMSLAVASGNALSPVHLDQAQIMDESFPGFVSTLQSLGAQVVMEGEHGGN